MREKIKNFRLPYIDSNMYIVCEKDNALIIDPVISEEAAIYLKNKGTKKITILLTHEHYDHTCGLCDLIDKFECHLICQRSCANAIMNKRNNRPVVMAAMMREKYNGEMRRAISVWPQGYICYPDEVFQDEMDITWFNHQIKMIHTPGHSPGSCCIELDQKFVFTGDSYIIDVPVILSLPGGSAEDYQNITEPYLKSIENEKTILPGHGEILWVF